MRNQYIQALRDIFHVWIGKSRSSLGVTQEEMAQRLAMAGRTYVELEHGRACCSAVTLALFLVYLCDDPQEFISELKAAFEEADSDAA